MTNFHTVGVAAIAAAAALAHARPAAAFVVEGHEAIEANAYAKLLAETAIDDGRGGKVTGVEVARYLVKHGVLQKPECFEATSKAEERRCAERTKAHPIAGSLVLGSGAPDLMTSRQFSTNGQCFHFMSSSAEVWSTEPDAKLGVPSGLLHAAYQRCTRVLGALLAETVHAPGAANRRYRGFYALVHAVTDSFSEAHVSRDREQKVRYLKPWQLRAFVPYLLPTRWNAWKHFGPDVHHALIDPRDDAYLVDRDECHQATKHPYAVPYACLTGRGRRATSAVVDLLHVVYRILHRRDPNERPTKAPKDDSNEGDEPRAASAPDVAGEWRAYIGRHFPSATDAPDLGPPLDEEREWTPEFVAGFRFRNNAVPDSTDLTTIFGTTLLSNVTLPIIPFVSAEVGCRRILGKCQLVMGVDPLALMIPLTESLQIGMTALSIVGHVSGDDPDVSIGANLGRADVYLLEGLWLSLAGPRYSWVHQRMEGERFAVSFGTAWSARTSVLGRIPLIGDPAAKGVEGLREQVDTRESAQHDDAPRVGEPWSPTRQTGDYRKQRWTNVIDVASGTVLPEGASGDYSLGGYSIFLDRDRYARRSGVAPGLRADTSFYVVDEDKYFGALVGPVLRVYVVPNLLALEASPLVGAAGYRKNAGDAAGFWDVSAQGHVVLLPLNQLEIGLGSPRFSYRTRERLVGTNLAVRLAFALESK